MFTIVPSSQQTRKCCPSLSDLPSAPAGRKGWPWTVGTPALSDSMADGRPWPRVSIVTPSYNQGQFIEETIRSVLLQGYPDLQYGIVDGGSTDGTLDIIRRYEPWLSFWISEADRGQTNAINKGWRKANGDAVTWLNSDDLLLPFSLPWTVCSLFQNDEVGLVYGDVLFIDEHSVSLQAPFDRFRGRPFYLEEVLRKWRNPIPQQGFLLRRSALDQVGYLDEDFQFSMDFEYWMRFALAGGRAEYLPQTLAAFRRHEGAKTTTIASRRIRDNYAIFDRVFSKPLPPPIMEAAKSARSALHLRAALISYLAGNAADMRRYAFLHIRGSGLESSPRAWLSFIISLAGDRFVSSIRRSRGAFDWVLADRS
jgi:glycosyltransferase involved in cell wall biosynthesis